MNYNESIVNAKVVEYLQRKTEELRAEGLSEVQIRERLKDVGETAEARMWRLSKRAQWSA